MNLIAKTAAASVFLALLAVPFGAQQSFPVVSTVDEPSIAGRAVALDSNGKLLPWPMPENTGYSYSSYFLSQWTVIWDQYNRQRLPYFYCCFDFDRKTYELIPEEHYVNSTAYLRAMMQGFVERLYAYTGDPRTLEFLQNFVDYELEHGTTPANYAWSGVPYPSANPGAREYSGWSEHGEDFIEPHVVGEDGYAYLRLYEMTGKTKYLQAAIRCAAALVKNFKTGDKDNSPWPFRCHARDGSLANGKGMGPYSANVVEPIMLLDELIRLRQGDVDSYQRVRDGAWTWLMKYPMVNNVWVGYFEDVGPNMENMNQVIPLEFARYVLLHPEKDAQWREHVRQLIEWVKSTPKWPKYIVHGATVTTEQGDGKSFCCNLPNQCCDSHTSRLAAVEAFYYAKTGDAAYQEAAYRSYNCVTYSTFDDTSTDVLRLDFVPETVMADGRPLRELHQLSASGYTFDSSSRVLRIRHDDARNIDVRGKSGGVVSALVTFDDPHLAAGTLLNGGYPSSQIDWGNSVWKIAPPGGQFATFHVVLGGPSARTAKLKFSSPRIFVGIDVCNDGAEDAAITIRSPEQQEQTVTLHAGELRRIRTARIKPSLTVEFEFHNPGRLRFDNLAYAQP